MTFDLATKQPSPPPLFILCNIRGRRRGGMLLSTTCAGQVSIYTPATIKSYNVLSIYTAPDEHLDHGKFDWKFIGQRYILPDFSFSFPTGAAVMNGGESFDCWLLPCIKQAQWKRFFFLSFGWGIYRKVGGGGEFSLVFSYSNAFTGSFHIASEPFITHSRDIYNITNGKSSIYGTFSKRERQSGCIKHTNLYIIMPMAFGCLAKMCLALRTDTLVYPLTLHNRDY